jgi:Lon protease-like protein
MTESELIPLFPLRSVLFPGGRLPLQIFEQRYLDLISHCMKTDSGFGVCLLSKGDESIKAGSMQQVNRTGTYAKIVDWDKLPNGLLGITVEGVRKFRVQGCWPREDKLLMAHVQWSDQDKLDSPPIALGPDQEELVGLLRELMSHPLVEDLGLSTDLTDQRQLAWRLAELLPVPAEEKQRLLELDDTQERLREIEFLIGSVMRHA